MMRITVVAVGSVELFCEEVTVEFSCSAHAATPGTLLAEPAGHGTHARDRSVPDSNGFAVPAGLDTQAHTYAKHKQ